MTQETPSAEPGPGPVEVEASGETVGEAKWAALRELERRLPSLDKATIRYQILSEGERGLLGVGRVPARVIAAGSERDTVADRSSRSPEEAADSSAAHLRGYLELVCDALGCPARIEIEETDQELAASLSGPDLGLVIGKRGQTIDAIQYLANAVLWRGETERKDTVVDAAGYRGRRQSSLEQAADRAAAEATAAKTAVSLDPMSAIERKIVHLRLAERTDVETTSDGQEPSRFVVVSPASPSVLQHED